MGRAENSQRMSKEKLSFIVTAGVTYSGNGHISNQLNALNRMFILLNYESDDYGLNSLKHMYIYTICSHLESLLRLTYGHVFIGDQNLVANSQHRNLVEIEALNLDNLTWSNLLKEDCRYLNFSIPGDVRKSDAFKAVGILFELRNRLIHGNSFELRTYENIGDADYKDERVVGKATSIYDYFVRKELMSLPKPGEGMHFPLSNQVIIHFIEQAFQFVKLYCTFLDKELPCDESAGQLPFTIYFDDLSGLLEKCKKALNIISE